jgi:hypothetical protein
MSILSRRGGQRWSPFLLSRSLRRQIGTVSTMARIQLEDPREIAYGSDILSLIAGHDVDADRRERNREIVSCGSYNHGRGRIGRDIWTGTNTLVSS